MRSWPLFLALLACEPMEPCPTGDDLSAWQLQRNTLVRKVDLPLDPCRRQPALRAELLPGGRVSASRTFSLSAAGTVYVDSRASHAAAGFTGPCLVPSVRVDGEVVPDIKARFSIKAGPHVAEVAVGVPADGRACAARMEPRMEVLP